MIIDVRTNQEFESDHIKGSINIPLTEIPMRLLEIKSLPKPLMICCASGVRSSAAHHFLVEQGIESTDLGSYKNVK